MNKKREPNINEQITSATVRVIDADGTQVGVLKRNEAIELAANQGLDLVEVSPESSPPVCKVLDYGKFKYKLSKKEKVTKKKQHLVQIKEIRFRPKIEEHDFNFKTNNARKFLEKGQKVKVTVQFRGREMAHLDFARTLLTRVASELEDIAKVDRDAAMEGRLMIMYLTKK
ncbi:MAG TPA: translation initiation factor IF-3 [bacterium]